MDERKPPDSGPNPIAAFSIESRKRREQDRYLHNLARANRGEDPIQFGDLPRPSSDRNLHSQMSKITAELEETKRKLAETEEALKKERLNPASRTGIYRTLFAALVSGFGFRPENEGALKSIPGQLVEDVAEVGRTLDVKTARSHVRGAFQQYKDDEPKR